MTLLLSALLLALYAPVQSGEANTRGAREACPPPARAKAASSAANMAAAKAAVAGLQQIVACVGSHAIAEATFAHWAGILRKEAEAPGAKERLSSTEVVKQVIGFLLTGIWVIDEAKARGIHVTNRQLHRRFDTIRNGEFHNRRGFEAFLGRTGQTVADLLLRVRVNLLATRIQSRVLAGHRGEASKQRALNRFSQSFKDRWKSITYCAPKYAIADCGHVRHPL